MTNDFGEFDVVRLTKSVTANAVGQQKQINVPVGAIGTVVLVHRVASQAEAYEVEFHIGEREYALATVRQVDLVSGSHLDNSKSLDGWMTRKADYV